MSLETAILILAVGIPVALFLRFIARPVDSRYVPHDGLSVEVEGEVPGLTEVRRTQKADDA